MTEVNLGSNGSVIKSIQRVTVTGMGSLTIAEVNPEKTTINLLTSIAIHGAGSTPYRDSYTVSIWLINSTTIGYRARTDQNVTLYAEVIEYV